ncbi:MAG: homocysteine S-methyltransferase [Solirubrobacterales bacterium]|jgi:S-methylmethionine-dependent homocysteine/selenocysteine methylase|nr:homocysteine S-methyltransferase [Solirubrobacterales bacterium]
MTTMRYRDHLPQLDGGSFLTDGGLETELIFHDGIDLPAFAAFTLLRDASGTARLRRYYERYLALAQERGLGLVLESPTWRASSRWGAGIGYRDEDLDRVNRDAIALLESIRETHQGATPVVISGCIGPQDDAYSPAALLSADEAQAYHAKQITTFADTAADLVSAMTLTYAAEAIGIARAAAQAGLPSVLSFTLETDGRLPSGQSLSEAIAEVDRATASAPAYYMINCAHPTHFDLALAEGDAALARVRALRANASTLSHAELDEAEVLDEGDAADLAARYPALRTVLPNLNVVGGCCGTDHRHVEAIRDAWLAAGAD